MKNIIQLLNYAENRNINIKSFSDKSKNINGLCLFDARKCNLYINSFIQNNTERKCILAEELGHYETGIEYSLLSKIDCENLTIRSRNEFRAKKWACTNLIPFEDFKRYLTANYSKFDIANELQVTEELVEMAFLFMSLTFIVMSIIKWILY